MSDKPISDDHQALRRVAEGGKARDKALEQLYRQHRPKLLGFLRKKGLSLDEAEDVVQQVFVQVVKNAGRFRGDSAVSSWMHQIAHNAMVDLFRGTHREVLVTEETWDELSNTSPDNVACPSSSDPKRKLQECFDVAYAAFRKAHPAAADLIYQTLENEDWETPDVAAYLGRTAGAAREYLSQCRKKLKKFMEPCRHLLGVQP